MTFMKKGLSGLVGAGLFLLPVIAWSQTPPPAPVAGADAATTPAGQAAPPADVQAAMQLPEGPPKAKALADAVKGWVIKDSVAAFTWIMAQPQPVFAQVQGTCTAAAASPNVKAGGDYLLQQTPDRATGMLHGFSIYWAYKDPAAAEAWCTQIQTTRDFRYIAVFSVADGLCRKKPTDAAAWALTLTQPDDHNAAIDGTITIWIRSDIPGMTAWIKQLNPATRNGRPWSLPAIGDQRSSRWQRGSTKRPCPLTTRQRS